ncbi:hypothetical protein LX69_03516 [Breznakibacter xylanolyticus]|uniref:Tox-MPTase2 domain-containing protein n=1 Tax=Breznakibacter xylanolyticus TaxID=990 RepID=A0A2W7MQT6_9BACT|nr:hypothetical protein [Breznakibacter xylanolyticus]PZX09811.1 hypothetical protein LX69_03516 [Breznakibacter xylanolyticus]
MHYLGATMDFINDNTVELRKAMVDIGVPDFNAGYNTSQGTYHSIGNSGNIYHNQLLATDEILGRTTITFNQPMGQAGANFIANMGVPGENVRIPAGGGIEQHYRNLINDRKYASAVQYLIKSYGLDKGVEGKYKVSVIVMNDNKTFGLTHGGPGEIHLVEFNRFSLRYNNFGTIVRGTYHEFIHVNQRENGLLNSNEREFLAYYGSIVNSELPAALSTDVASWKSNAQGYYNAMPISSQLYYLPQIINLSFY